MDRLLSGVEGVAIRSPIAAGAAAWRDRLVRAEQRREAEQPAAAACAPCVEDVGGVRSTCQNRETEMGSPRPTRAWPFEPGTDGVVLEKKCGFVCPLLHWEVPENERKVLCSVLHIHMAK
jgi:hypothetical protein